MPLPLSMVQKAPDTPLASDRIQGIVDSMRICDEISMLKAGLLMEPSNPVHGNVETILRHEQEFLARRSHAERLGDSTAAIVGSLGFVACQLLFVAGWILVNVSQVFAIRHFDPVPFSLLSCWGIKRQSERYWPDGMRRLFLPLHDWALARKLLGKLPAAQELTAEMLAHTG